MWSRPHGFDLTAAVPGTAVPPSFRTCAGLPLPILNYPGGAESPQVLITRLVVAVSVGGGGLTGWYHIC